MLYAFYEKKYERLPSLLKNIYFILSVKHTGGITLEQTFFRSKWNRKNRKHQKTLEQCEG